MFNENVSADVKSDAANTTTETDKVTMDSKPAAEKTPFFDDRFKHDAGSALKSGLCGAIAITPVILTMVLLGRVFGSSDAAE